MKTCTKCGQTKPLNEFYGHKNPNGKRPDCKTCNKALAGVRQKKRRRKTPEVFANTALRQKFGISLDVYNLMLEDQGGGCQICGTKNSGKGKRYFSVDHDHKTGRIRGLLCHSCNAGLGMFKDNPDFLQSAIKYLKEQF